MKHLTKNGLSTLWMGLLLSLCLQAPLAQALSETQYSQQYRAQVLPWAEENLQPLEFITADNLRIQWYSVRFEGDPAQRKGTLLISPGRTESVLNFLEVMYELREQGYDMAVIDHRGQGFSDRLTANTSLGHVEAFSDYVRDWHQFQRTVQQHFSGPYYLLAHSMGAAISVLGLKNNPDFFDKIVLSAPMFEVQTHPYPKIIAQGLARTLVFLGFSKRYIPREGPFDPTVPFEENDYSRSKARYQQNLLNHSKHPQQAIGGPSNRWALEALSVPRLLKKGTPWTNKPILILQAEKEHVVFNSAQNDFCQSHSHCQKQIFKSARHSLHLDKDETFQVYLKSISDFLH